ncbi:hypothetical protein [Acinetobacter baumannii]|uniref:hypothetical protein n=1 Tax=Acinetobacter baumannii TaxID=470 RepID=UPI002B237BAC|nr:hypothetical protein [Acinetobacter baumannii]
MEGQVIVDDFDLAQQIFDASSFLIGKRGVFGWIIQRVRIGAALPAIDAGRTGYKISTI